MDTQPMIGVVVRELTFLKVLHPIMEELHRTGAPYVLYHFDAPRGSKEYNRASLAKLKLSSPGVVANAAKVKAFGNDNQLLKQLVHDKITKLVSLEVYLWAKDYINELKKNNIGIYNILYLTDSLWTPDPKNITSCDRVYYSSQHLMNLHLDMLGLKLDPKRDKWLGSPIYDGLRSDIVPRPGLLVLLPNLLAEHVQIAFGGKDNFLKMMDNICRGNEHHLIFKTRKKQWMPDELKKYGALIIDDGDKMYPPSISGAFAETHCVVMFYSSGIYECMVAGKHVVNIPLNLKRWSHDKKKMKDYFESPVYNFREAVWSVSQEEALSPDFQLIPPQPDGLAIEDWLSQYVGMTPPNSSQAIVKDILS